jgi:hypothetical protein
MLGLAGEAVDRVGAGRAGAAERVGAGRAGTDCHVATVSAPSCSEIATSIE